MMDEKKQLVNQLKTLIGEYYDIGYQEGAYKLNRSVEANYTLHCIDGCISKLLEVSAEQHDVNKQAIIDRLMMEYCPEEMTEEQQEEWSKNQVKHEI